MVYGADYNGRRKEIKLTYKDIRSHQAYCLDGLLSRGPADDRYKLLMRVLDDVGEPNHLTRIQIEEWLDGHDWTSETKRNYLGHLRGYYDWAVKTERVSVDPTAGIKLPPSPRRRLQPARIREYKRFMREAEPRWRAVAALATYAGLGPSEIVRLLRSHIDEYSIRITQGDGAGRTVATHREVWRHVQELPQGHIIAGARGEPLEPTTSATTSIRT